MNSAKFWKNIEFLFYFLNYGKRGKMDAKREESFCNNFFKTKCITPTKNASK